MSPYTCPYRYVKCFDRPAGIHADRGARAHRLAEEREEERGRKVEYEVRLPYVLPDGTEVEIVGHIDVVDFEMERIIELKHSSRVRPYHTWQANAYRYLMELTHGGSWDAVVRIIDADGKIVHSQYVFPSPTVLRELLDNAEKLVKAFKKGYIPRNPGEWCEHCDLRDKCNTYWYWRAKKEQQISK